MTHTAAAGAAITRRWETPTLAGIAAFALATGLGAVAIFGPQRQEDQVDAFPALVVFFAILTALVFALVVRPAAANGATPRRVLVLGATALLSNVVFWTGLPAVLSVAALTIRPHAPVSRVRAVGTGMAAAALAGNIVAAVVA